MEKLCGKCKTNYSLSGENRCQECINKGFKKHPINQNHIDVFKSIKRRAFE